MEYSSSSFSPTRRAPSLLLSSGEGPVVPLKLRHLFASSATATSSSCAPSFTTRSTGSIPDPRGMPAGHWWSARSSYWRRRTHVSFKKPWPLGLKRYGHWSSSGGEWWWRSCRCRSRRSRWA